MHRRLHRRHPDRGVELLLTGVVLADRARGRSGAEPVPVARDSRNLASAQVTGVAACLRAHLRQRYGDKVSTPLIETRGGLLSRRTPGVGAHAYNPSY